MRVFISHSDEDQDRIRELVRQLENEGLDVFYDANEVFPGDNWAAKVGKAIESSQAMVVVLTEGASRSQRVQRDIQYALSSLKYKNRLITVVVDKSAEVPSILKRLPLIEVRRNNLTEAGKRVAEELRGVAA